jgi:Cofilin/tropomyosin-type actin-binding protein
VYQISVEDLVMELPDTTPRYVLYSYKYTHSDGRMSYPLCMIYYVPRGIRTSLNMLYASTKPVLVQTFSLMKVVCLFVCVFTLTCGCLVVLFVCVFVLVVGHVPHIWLDIDLPSLLGTLSLIGVRSLGSGRLYGGVAAGEARLLRLKG